LALTLLSDYNTWPAAKSTQARELSQARLLPGMTRIQRAIGVLLDIDDAVLGELVAVLLDFNAQLGLFSAFVSAFGIERVSQRFVTIPV
jgi:hypothetical protein